MKIVRLLALLALIAPAVAQAWWNKDWTQRTEITLNTTAAGVATHDTVADLTVPVRLHSGNFDFLGAKPDGADLRVVAADDKTPIKFWIERFDTVNELAVVWVRLNVLPGTDKNVFYIYAGNDKATADPATGTVFDSATLAAFHFAEKDGIAADDSGAIKAEANVPIEPNGLIGPSAHLGGTPINWTANDKLKAPGAGPWSVSFWIKPETASGTLFRQGPIQIALGDAGALSAQIGALSVAGGQVAAGTWSHIALTVGSGKASLYVNGAQAGQGDVPAAASAIEGPVQVGDGYKGLLDELELAGSARSPEWLKLDYAAESADAKLVATKGESRDSADAGGSGSYFGILFKSLTPDAWVVIGILAVMFLIAAAVMVTKAMYVSRTENANQRFLTHFRELTDVLILDPSKASGQFEDSSLYRLYRAGVRELTKRDVGRNDRVLSGASLDAVKAAVDADSVRESYKLNARMVLLTIAISGGPFLGLLGTVIGVMITFASIAAAGDVNVNAIAPGIAAALLATVAGLSVAIPSLFGYNYLASRIKTISSDMQIFIDEFVTRIAETYGAH
jgi:biopolymer transport protein ExbB